MTGNEVNRVTTEQRTLAEQLRPLQPSVRQRHSSVTPVSQVLLHLRGANKSRIFDKARSQVLQWMSERAGRPLPPEALKGEAFELEEVGSQRVAAATIETPRYWAGRLDDADKSVPQRQWVTEVGIADDPADGIVFGARLVCVTRGRDDPYDRTVPSFVRQVASPGIAWLDGVPVRGKPWLVADEPAVDELVSLLKGPRRTDVIVLALPEESENIADTVIPATEVHHRTLGAAHVVVLTGPASFLLSDRLGKTYSVFRQGIRTYKPGFDPDRDEPYSHPLALPHRVRDWPAGGPSSYMSFLVNQSLGRSVARADLQDVVPPFARVRQLATRLRFDTARKGATSDKDLLAVADEEIRDLKAELEEQKQVYDSLIQTLEDERSEAQAAAEAANNRASGLRRRLESLERVMTSRRGAQPPTTPIPESLEGFEEWCGAHLSGYVELSGRALQGVKKSEYHDLSLIYRSLLLLRDHYVPMKRDGGMDLKNAFEAQCRALGVEESQTFSGSRWGEEGNTYTILFAGRRRLLDRHLKKGDSREPRRCFRLYFFWDEDSEQVIVGWLTSHLDNRLT